jgi:hypothetical protein
MAYSGVANNQTVSLDNLKDAVANNIFLQLTTIPTGSKQITKSEASTYVNCATYYAPFAAKASNQLVVKSDLVGRVVIPISLAWDSSNQGTLAIYTASPVSAGYTLQTTLTAPGGSAGTTSTTISLVNGDGIYTVLTHTARTSNGQRGQIFQSVNGSSTTFQTAAGALPRSITSTALTLSHLNSYSIDARVGNPV